MKTNTLLVKCLLLLIWFSFQSCNSIENVKSEINQLYLDGKISEIFLIVKESSRIRNEMETDNKLFNQYRDCVLMNLFSSSKFTSFYFLLTNNDSQFIKSQFTKWVSENKFGTFSSYKNIPPNILNGLKGNKGQYMGLVNLIPYNSGELFQRYSTQSKAIDSLKSVFNLILIQSLKSKRYLHANPRSSGLRYLAFNELEKEYIEAFKFLIAESENSFYDDYPLYYILQTDGELKTSCLEIYDNFASKNRDEFINEEGSRVLSKYYDIYSRKLGYSSFGPRGRDSLIQHLDIEFDNIGFSKSSALKRKFYTKINNRNLRKFLKGNFLYSENLNEMPIFLYVLRESKLLQVCEYNTILGGSGKWKRYRQSYQLVAYDPYQRKISKKSKILFGPYPSPCPASFESTSDSEQRTGSVNENDMTLLFNSFINSED